MSAVRSLAAVAVALGILAACGGGSPASPTQSATPTVADQPTDEPTAEPTEVTAIPSPTAGETATGEATSSPAAGTPAAGVVPDLARIATGETPTGWKEARSADGGCRMAVPPDWDTETLPGTAMAHTLGAQVILSNDQLANYGSWDAYNEAAKTAYFGSDKIVLVENDDLFVMTTGPSNAGWSAIVGRHNGDTVCGVLLTVNPNGMADLLAIGQQILYSLAPAG
jgi:hypothetical protein